VTRRIDLAVVGGGISGLAAAWAGMRQGADVVVLEAGDAPGGKLRTSPIAGIEIDEGADAFLARVPEAVALCEELGLGAELVPPATGSAYLWIDGVLRPLPPEQLLGVPTDLDAVGASGILSAAGVERARADLTAPDDAPRDGDEAIGALVRRRLGDEVLDRLVAPLLGGIWAGDCDRLSLRVAAATLAEARDRDASLIRGAATLRAEALERGDDRPVFLAPRGGMARLVDALTERLGERLRCGAPVIGLAPDGAGWRLATGSAGHVGAHGSPAVLADRVVLTTPAYVTGPLLANVAPELTTFLSGIDYASVVLTVLVAPREGIDHPLDGSGFLVPQSSGRLLTACSWMTSKWAHLDGDPSTVVLRASAGRVGDQRAMTLTDDELVAALVEDLRDTIGLHAAPSAVRVNRWERSFPQPRPGHLDALAAAELALAERAPGLTMAGAWALGVGIPACIRAAARAVSR
jgi:protoporphyrinogen/coproporphyrinogen III oxidase